MGLMAEFADQAIDQGMRTEAGDRNERVHEGAEQLQHHPLQREENEHRAQDGDEAHAQSRHGGEDERGRDADEKLDNLERPFRERGKDAVAEHRFAWGEHTFTVGAISNEPSPMLRPARAAPSSSGLRSSATCSAANRNGIQPSAISPVCAVFLGPIAAM